MKGFKFFNALILFTISASLVLFAAPDISSLGKNSTDGRDLKKILGTLTDNSDAERRTFSETSSFYKVFAEEISDLESDIPVIKAGIAIDDKTVYVSQYIKYPLEQNDFMINIPSANYADTDIKSISSCFGISDFSLENENLLKVSLRSAGNLVRIEYSVTLRDNGDILSQSESRVLLTNMLMTPVVFSGNVPVTAISSQIGDPVTYGVHDYDISLVFDSKLSAFAPGKTDSQLEEGLRIERFRVNNFRDFPIVLFNAGVSTAERQIGDTKVIFVNDSEIAEPFVDYAFSFAEKNLADYPYSDFFVVRTDFNKKGMEHSGMILLNDSVFSDTNYLKSVTYHEVFHQWFYGLVGSDQVNQPYLDEGMATFLADYLMNYKTPQNPEKDFTIPLMDYQNQSVYYSKAYTASAGHISSHLERLGEEEFFRILKKICNDKKYSIIYYDEFDRYFY